MTVFIIQNKGNMKTDDLCTMMVSFSMFGRWFKVHSQEVFEAGYIKTG